MKMQSVCQVITTCKKHQAVGGSCCGEGDTCSMCLDVQTWRENPYLQMLHGLDVVHERMNNIQANLSNSSMLINLEKSLCESITHAHNLAAEQGLSQDLIESAFDGTIFEV